MQVEDAESGNPSSFELRKKFDESLPQPFSLSLFFENRNEMENEWTEFFLDSSLHCFVDNGLKK